MKDKYAAFAKTPHGHFPYPIGASSAISLGYDERLVARVPLPVSERYVGVGNAIVAAGLKPGDRVLDIGCGVGFDVFVAAQVVGATGSVVGIDMTRAMVEMARSVSDEFSASGEFGRVEFVEGSAEMLPFRGGEFDVVISNGVMNLVPDKDRAFAQVYRVLKPGGVFAFADLLLEDNVENGANADVSDDPAAWAT